MRGALKLVDQTVSIVSIAMMSDPETMIDGNFSSDERREQWIEGRFHTSDAHCGKPSVIDYRLYLPASTSSKNQAPLLVMLHGCQQNARAFAEGTRMNAVAGRHEWVVLYPEQSKTSNPMRCWNWFDPVSLNGGGEAAAIARLIDDVASRYAIDRARIYVAGMSAGGAMALLLAVRHASMFAACAVHSGVMYKAATSVLQAFHTLRSGSRASPQAVLTELEDRSGVLPGFVPTLVIHGDEDDAVNPINAAQIVQQCKVLATAHTSAPLSGPHEQHASSGGRSYVIRDYSGQGRVWIRDINVHGLAHAWSGGDARHPFNDPAGPCASELIREFLALHRREEVAVKLAKLHGDTLRERDSIEAHPSRRRQPMAGRLRELLSKIRRRS